MRKTEIRVIRANLDVSPARLDVLGVFLSAEERERASRFKFPNHRQLYMACRGILREILASHLETEPQLVPLDYNPYGKPYIPGSELRFNLSHSAEHALYAVARGREVGVDIELIDPQFAREQIPERFFSAGEVSQLRALPVDEQTEAFFRCWTRKEAYIKARGLGLALPLDSFDVSLLPGEPPAFLRGVENWTLSDISVPEEFAAALVVEGAENEFVILSHGST